MTKYYTFFVCIFNVLFISCSMFKFSFTLFIYKKSKTVRKCIDTNIKFNATDGFNIGLTIKMIHADTVKKIIRW